VICGLEVWVGGTRTSYRKKSSLLLMSKMGSGFVLFGMTSGMLEFSGGDLEPAVFLSIPG
jgi:hypothetical protein